MNWIFLAAASFQGGGLVLTWASWSLIFGFQTPLQSGSLPRSVQSCAVGGSDRNRQQRRQQTGNESAAHGKNSELIRFHARFSENKAAPTNLFSELIQRNDNSVSA
jgi:hypothetical protein